MRRSLRSSRIQLPSSHSAESAADQIGIELAAKAGYDPHAALPLWRKMEAAAGSGPPPRNSCAPIRATANRHERHAALAPQPMAYYDQAPLAKGLRASS